MMIHAARSMPIFDGMDTDLHEIIIEQDGINHVKVLKPASSNSKRLIWSFSLHGDNEPIIFKEFYTASKFAIINWNGWLRAYDLDAQEKIYETQLEGSVDTRAVFSPDKAMLYVAYNKDYNPMLASFPLADLSKGTVSELPEKLYSGHLQMRGDGRLLMYFNEEEYISGEEKWTHGYVVYDPGTSQPERYEMPYAQRDSFEAKEPAIHAGKNIGVMPYWGDLEIEKSEMGGPRFIYKIMVFDLSTFNVLRIIPVRAFSTSQLACYESECDEMAEIFQERPSESGYDEAFVSFCNELYSIVFDKYDDAVWLCWRGGIVRKVGLDGSISPLLITTAVQGEANQEFAFFHAFIKHIEDDFLILEEGKKYKMPLADVDLTSGEEYIPVTLSVLDEEIITSDPATEEQFQAEKGKVVIVVDDLNQAESLLHALDQMATLTEDIPALGYGDKLAFLIKDTIGLTMDDRQFFKKALPIPGAPEKIKKVVDNFIRYERAGRLYIDSEETALCYAVYELASSSPAYIETALRYLSVIDEDHDVFNTETLIPTLMEVYKGTEHEAVIREGILKVSNGWWAEGV
ncbi:hypothetical protein GCM10009122_57750 [Fulvivirga kasyanovii]|uniref:WD40 repeat domain-containing protein n=1 Tax=Fulvivirga kasyanovii TaxID=396812 RepID=A0ABW9RN18_9BACT|nr:hypothetical protein [Fulvivirga kasyanovii]MTI25381.1 hypothetical protein [Fulvivirga kasyanovii]